jgi:hypothetical protein
MALNLVQMREAVQKKEDENYSFHQFLKTGFNLKSDEIDQARL